MKLIISEKPSTAKILAHAVGAREKIYGEGKEFCYKGNGYYVVNARGHLYSLGLPQDYGYSRSYKMDELPMFPDFQLFPADSSADGLRTLISQLINLDEVDELICATDAGREGELIFRHIYNANLCTKPVKRLWCNSMTDEAIRKCLDDLPSDSDFDGEYCAALAREKSDWIIGMNLSRLYGILDNYPHRIGRVKTPVLSIIAQRDKEISDFKKSVTYRLELDNGAVSEREWDSSEEAERKLALCRERTVTVISAVSEEKKINRPLLHSLTALQQEANRIYGFTAKETLETAQSLYEKKMITYPRTDCNYVSEDMRGRIIGTIEFIGEDSGYTERVNKLKSAGFNLDSRIINTKAMDGHDHHAIIPEINGSAADLNDRERKIYGLVVNRLLCGADREYRYTETNYTFSIGENSCGEITFILKSVNPTEMGWKKYFPDKSENPAYINYAEGEVFTPKKISVRKCVTKPKNHFTDETLLSVMNNIDNRIDDRELKAAVSGKGIGTEATRAEIIEQLIGAEYIKREGKSIVVTDFGRRFAESIPDNLKSAQRTAEWEQIFDRIKTDNSIAETFLEEVKDFVRAAVEYENAPSVHRTPVKHESANAAKRNIVGKCPRCGGRVIEGEKGYYCENEREKCGFVL